ncbi:unnamed protein product [Closterium sp. NIES-53]
MASLRVLAFDHEVRPIKLDMWLDDLQLYLLSDIKDGVSLFDHVSSAATAPPTTTNGATRSQWLSRDAAARLAIHNHLPLAECAHFGQHRTAQALYDAVVARYSSPTTAALGRLLLPYLFPDLSSFAKVEDLVSHLRASDAHYRAAVPAEFLDKNQPPMFITLYFIVTRLPVSLRSARDHFLSLDPTSLTVDLLEKHLLVAETSAVAVGAAHGTPRPPFFEGCSPSPLAPLLHPSRRHLAIAIFDLDFDAILSGMYALSVSAEGDCYRCVPPDPGKAAAALGASVSSTLRGTAPAEALHTFTLDSSASRCFFRDSTTLTPLPTPIPVRLADPSGGPLVARSSTVLPCPAVPSGSLSGLHLPSFSTNLVSIAALQDAMVTTTTPGGQRVLICTCIRTGRHLATFTRRPGSSLYTLALEPSQVAASAQVSASGQVAASCSCRLLSHQTLQWHHRLGHPSLPRLRGMHPRLLVYGLPRTLPPLPPSPAPPCLPCVKGRQRAAPHSSSFPPDDCSPADSPHRRRRIGLVMEVARTSMIHAAAPHFLCPFAVRYTAHQLNLWPRVSLPETSPTLCWTGEVGDASMFRFYHPTSRRVFPSQDVTFDESVPFYRLFPFRSAPPPPPPLFLPPNPPPEDPLPMQGPAPSGVSHVDPLPGPAPFQVAVGSGAPRGAASGGAASGGAEPEGAGSEGAETGGAEPGSVATRGGEPGGAEPEGVEPGDAASEGADSGGAEPQGSVSYGGSASASPRLSPQQLHQRFVRRRRLRSGAGGTGVAAGVGVTGGTATTSPEVARTQGTRAAGTGCVEGAGVGDLSESGATCAGGARAGGAGVGGTGTGGAGVGGPGVGGALAGGAGAIDPGGAVRPRPYFVPLIQQSGGLTEHHEPASCHVSPVRTARRVPRLRPPFVPGTHAMTLHPSSVPLRVPLPAPPESSLPEVPDPASDRARAASPTVSRLLTTAVTDPSFESAAASALVAELLDFAAACRLDYATALVAEFASASSPSVAGECALGTDVLEDRQEDFECLAAAVPRFASMLLAPEGDPDAPDIPTPRSYAEAIMGPYSLSGRQPWMPRWHPGSPQAPTSMRVKRPPDSSPAFKARYVAQAFSQRQGVDFFQTFSPTPKMTTLQGSLHEEIWLRRPPGFTGSFLAGTQWSLQRPFYGLCQVPHEWHDTLRTTHAALGFAPFAADPSLFLRTDTSLPLFYVLLYVDDLGFATADTDALALVKSFSASASDTPRHSPLLCLPVTRSQLHFGRVRRAEWPVSRACGMPHYVGHPAFKARYVARGFSQQQGVDYFHTFSPTPKMTTLQVFLHVAAQRDYELHSLDFSIAFLQGSLHEEIWLRRPPGFTGSFPAGTQWSLQWPVYGLCQAPHEWHDTLRKTLAALGFAPSAADPSLFLHTDTSLPLFYFLLYVDDLAFATADTDALALVKSFSASASDTPRHSPLLCLPVTRSQLHFGRVRRAEWPVSRACGMPHYVGHPAFKARYVAQGFSQQQGVDYFQTFSPTPKMTNLRVLLHIAAQRDYELHSLDFSTTFLQGNLHEEIWLRRPPGFTESFLAGTQWSIRRLDYGLRQAPYKWLDTLRTTLAALGFTPSTADPSLFLRIDTSLLPTYVDGLVFATVAIDALTLVKSELQKRHTCIDLGELCSYLSLQITRDRARRTITLTQSDMMHQVLQRFGFQFSAPQPTPLSTSHSLSAPPSDESGEPSGPFPELVGCHITSGMGLMLGGRGPVVLTGHADPFWVDDSATQRSSQGYTFSLGFGSVSWRSTRSSLVLSSSCEAEIYAGAMAAQELHWLTYLLTDLGE